MAFTVVTSWDFRGSDSESTKLASRIGSYTLTKQGTPTVNTDGITCDTAGEGLTLTLPSELKYAEPFWLMYSLRRVAAISDGQSILGFISNAIDAFPRFNLAHIVDPGGVTGSQRTNSNGDQQSGNAETAAVPPDDANTVYVQTRTASAATLYKANTLVSTAINLTAWPNYTATSHLAVGCRLGVSVNPQMRYHWLLVGTGAITTGEMATIQADPDAYIYPTPSGPSPAALAFFLRR